jgi:hypothetical protein
MMAVVVGASGFFNPPTAAHNHRNHAQQSHARYQQHYLMHD